MPATSSLSPTQCRTRLQPKEPRREAFKRRPSFLDTWSVIAKSKPTSAILMLFLPSLHGCRYPRSQPLPASGDIAIIRLEAVQGVAPQDSVVADRMTIARVELTSSFPTDVSV